MSALPADPPAAARAILTRFRAVALAEGASFVALLFVAMPLKYLAGLPAGVKVVGWIHGLLFIAYVAAAVPLFTTLGWPPRRLAVAMLAALLPFGTFWLDRRYVRPALDGAGDRSSKSAGFGSFVQLQ